MMYPDLTYDRLGNLTWSFVSVGTNPTAFDDSISSFREGSKIHFSFGNLLPFFF